MPEGSDMTTIFSGPPGGSGRTPANFSTHPAIHPQFQPMQPNPQHYHTAGQMRSRSRGAIGTTYIRSAQPPVRQMRSLSPAFLTRAGSRTTVTAPYASQHGPQPPHLQQQQQHAQAHVNPAHRPIFMSTGQGYPHMYSQSQQHMHQHPYSSSQNAGGVPDGYPNGVPYPQQIPHGGIRRSATPGGTNQRRSHTPQQYTSVIRKSGGSSTMISPTMLPVLHGSQSGLSASQRSQGQQRHSQGGLSASQRSQGHTITETTKQPYQRAATENVLSPHGRKSAEGPGDQRYKPMNLPVQCLPATNPVPPMPSKTVPSLPGGHHQSESYPEAARRHVMANSSTVITRRVVQDDTGLVSREHSCLEDSPERGQSVATVLPGDEREQDLDEEEEVEAGVHRPPLKHSEPFPMRKATETDHPVTAESTAISDDVEYIDLIIIINFYILTFFVTTCPNEVRICVKTFLYLMIFFELLNAFSKINS